MLEQLTHHMRQQLNEQQKMWEDDKEERWDRKLMLSLRI